MQMFHNYIIYSFRKIKQHKEQQQQQKKKKTKKKNKKTKKKKKKKNKHEPNKHTVCFYIFPAVQQ